MERCPQCGGNLVKICYGFPSAEMWEKYERKEIYLGGCISTIYSYHCYHCDRSFPDFERITEYETFKQFEQRLHEIMDSPYLFEYFTGELNSKEDISAALEIMNSSKDKTEIKHLLWERFI